MIIDEHTDVEMEAPRIEPKVFSENYGDILIYPNPSNGLVNIQVSEVWIGASAEVFDLVGRIVRKSEIKSEQTSLVLAEGMYLLRICKNNEVETQKFIIQ